MKAQDTEPCWDWNIQIEWYKRSKYKSIGPGCKNIQGGICIYNEECKISFLRWKQTSTILHKLQTKNHIKLEFLNPSYIILVLLRYGIYFK